MKAQLVLPNPEVVRAKDLFSKFPDGVELMIQHEVFQILRKEILETEYFLAALGTRLSELLAAIEDEMTL